MGRPRKGRDSQRTRGAGSSALGETVPSIYKEMLRDAMSSSPPLPDGERPLKKRRVGGQDRQEQDSERLTKQYDRGSAFGDITDGAESENQHRSDQFQTAYHDSEGSAESDVNWEEVQLEEDTDLKNNDSTDAQELDLVLGETAEIKQAHRQQSRRRPATPAERKAKLDVHKMHVLCLLAHVHLRNHWCNDEEVHKSTRNIVSKKTVSYLNPDENLSQFQRTRSFNDGLGQAVDNFKLNFTLTARGMSRSHWAEDIEQIADISLPSDLDLPMQKIDFQDAAKKREGSRDVGAQLFCALLRSVGVDARLTCSLQPLPFHAYSKTQPTQSKESLAIDKYHEGQIEHTKRGNVENMKARSQSPGEGTRPIGSVGGRNRFVSNSSTDIIQGSSISNSNLAKKPSIASTNRRKRIVESSHPIYWVEAFDEAAQKWVPVDPIVTKTVGKSRKLEPPTSDRENNMSYVISFEDDGSARDVTKRYAKAYNAKTRRTRVEATEDGERWLGQVLRLYKRSHRLDRDQVEDTELARKEAQEGLPQNVQDFKDHPYYALERHLRRNEVIYPKREVGKVAAGKASSTKGVESIYRRRDVQIVKSADSWYRLGREIKASSPSGEQPLKRAVPRRAQGSSKDDIQDVQPDEDGDEEDAGTPLYAFHQTIEYKPPPVVSGRIPKNVYGNLDVYVPSMVPPGAVHLKNPETQRAAKLLGVDFADAITGFAFKGRHGTAIINGAIVAIEHTEALQEVLDAFENDRVHVEQARRSLEALRMWKRLLAGLRIRARIEGYEVEGENDNNHDEALGEDEAVSSEEGGGFFPDPAEEPIAEPTARRMPFHSSPDGQLEQHGHDHASGVVNRGTGKPEERHGQDSSRRDEESGGGGFLLEEDDADAVEAYIDNANKAPDARAAGYYGNSKGGIFLIEDGAGGSENTRENEQESVRRTLPLVSIQGGPTKCHGYRDEHSGRVSPAETYEKPPKVDDLEPSAGHFSADPSPSDLGLPDDELAEATILQQFHEASKPTSQLATTGLYEHDSLSNYLTNTNEDGFKHEEQRDEEAIPEASVQDEISLAQSTPKASPASDFSEDGSGSLLAEDPSDEDADPEWLA